MNKPISSMMTSQVWTANMDDTVESIEAFMNSHRLSWVPVREPNGTIVGAISSTDLLQFHARKKDPATVSAWQMCNYKPIAVRCDTSIGDVAKLMVERRIHHVVVTENDAIVGVVSSLDFVRRCMTNGT